MSKKLYSKKVKADYIYSSRVLRKVSLFEEKPSDARFDGDRNTGGDNTLKAHELFSIFTADIIKQEIIFTR
jgi:hypothetical protein